jgi:hypothetical protein
MGMLYSKTEKAIKNLALNSFPTDITKELDLITKILRYCRQFRFSLFIVEWY